MRLVVAGFVIALVVATALASFTWPSARLAPRDLPLGIAGRTPAAIALHERLSQRGDAFELRRYGDEAAARDAIEDRDVYGALVVSDDRTMLLTASAASPAVAQFLGETFTASRAVQVNDVVPADADDPLGVALTSMALPLTLVGLIVGVISAVLMPPGFRRVAGLAAGAALVGLVAIGLVQGWLGVLPGHWWLNAGVLALIALAIGSPVAGLAALLGYRGVALAAALLVFCGNPWSGISTAPELLPEWVGVTGQLLPPGAGGSLLRSTAFFDGGGSAASLIVLLVWTGLGLAAVSAATLRERHATVKGGTNERD